jgi:hypothetical protein
MTSEDTAPDTTGSGSGADLGTKLRGWFSDAVGGANFSGAATPHSDAFVCVLELVDLERSYSGLAEAIGGYANALQLTESAWILAASTSPVAIRDDLKRFVGDNDRLFVAKLSGPMAFSNTLSSAEQIKTLLEG